MNPKRDMIRFKLHRKEDCWKDDGGWDLTIRMLNNGNNAAFTLFRGVHVCGKYSTLQEAIDRAPAFVTTNA